MNDFQNSNFTDITYEKIDDLILGWLKKDGEVEKVEINGSTEYNDESTYKLDNARVVIYYHTFPEHEKEQIDKKHETTTETEEITTEAEEIATEAEDFTSTEEVITVPPDETLYRMHTINYVPFGSMLEIQGILFYEQTAQKYVLKYIQADYQTIATFDSNSIEFVDNNEKLNGLMSNSEDNKYEACRIICRFRDKDYKSVDDVKIYFDDLKYDNTISAVELLEKCTEATNTHVIRNILQSEIYSTYNLKWIRLQGVVTGNDKEKELSIIKGEYFNIYINQYINVGESIDKVGVCGIFHDNVCFYTYK